MKFHILAAALAATLASFGAAVPAPVLHRAAQEQSAKPTIVLVHGAFADGTGWQSIIPLLEKDGYPVIAAQNPLASLAGDVATTKRLIDAQKGPVVVVGHSYGGAVITGAAADNPNVKALVYLAAFAPEAGEPLGAPGEKYPAALGKALVPDAAGFLTVDRAKFRAVFCADVPEEEARIMAATQKPLAGAIFGQSYSYSGVEDNSHLVPRFSGRSGHQPGSGTFLRQTHGSAYLGDQGEPCGLYLPSQRGRGAD